MKIAYRWLVGGIGYLLYTLALLVLLLWLLFPKEGLHRLLVRYLNGAYPQLSWQVQSLNVRIPEGVTLGAVEGCEVRNPKKSLVRIDHLAIWPDFTETVRSRSLRAGYRILLAKGVVAGTLQMRGRENKVRIDGSVQGVELAECAVLARLLARELHGTVAATFGGTFDLPSGKAGEMAMKLRIDNGRLELKRPVLNHTSLPFSQATLNLHGRGETLEVEQGRVESELFSGQFVGAIQLHRELATSQIEIRGTLQPRPEFFKSMDNSTLLQAIRTQVKNSGLPFRVSGDLDQPGIHFEEFSQLFLSLEKELK